MTVLASFEDIIYIIIGLLWVAFSFYNAKKKKNAKKVPTPANKQKSMLESLLNEIRDEDQKNDPSLYEPAQEIDQHEEEPMHIEEEEIFSYDDYYEESNPKSTIDVITQTTNTPVTTIDDNPLKVKTINTIKKRKNIINLRKAVIYSEILKKVYF